MVKCLGAWPLVLVLALQLGGVPVVVTAVNLPIRAGVAPSIDQRPIPDTTQRVYAPLPDSGWLDGDIVLNNNSPEAMQVRPTFYIGGVPVHGDPLRMCPESCGKRKVA